MKSVFVKPGGYLRIFLEIINNKENVEREQGLRRLTTHRTAEPDLLFHIVMGHYQADGPKLLYKEGLRNYTTD